MALIKLLEGLLGSVWQAAFIRDAVILPARYVNHNLQPYCFRVSFSTARAISGVR